MKYRKRRYFTESDKALIWDRWQKGDSLLAVLQLSTYEKAPHGGGAKSLIFWCRHQESNSGPEVYKTPALPTEL